VHLLSNLIASEQLHRGDMISIDFDPEKNELIFVKEAEGMPADSMVQMIDLPPASLTAAAAPASAERKAARAANAKGDRIR
jgi:ribosomal protein L12E/L44/L45/RPP1/RPP2